MLRSFVIVVVFFPVPFKLNLLSQILTQGQGVISKLCIGVINNAHLINYSEQMQWLMMTLPFLLSFR